MSNQLPRSRSERKAAYHANASYSKHMRRFDTSGPIRLAGRIWQVSDREKADMIRRSADQKQSNNSPLWFDKRTERGPDEDYGTIEYLTYRPALIR